MIRSRICDMLGIRFPVFQGGMAWIADASLASAVSNAGGLGIISSINAGTDAVQEGDRNGSYMAGECAGMVRHIEPARNIVEDLILGAEKVIMTIASRCE